MKLKFKRARPALLLAAAIVAGGGIGIAGVAVAQASDQPANRSEMAPPTYARNAEGLSYGSAADATALENEPDLILVVATNGKQGYVYKTQLEPTPASNPAQATEMMKAKKTQADPAQIPVYLADGKTQIGWFAFSK